MLRPSQQCVLRPHRLMHSPCLHHLPHLPATVGDRLAAPVVVIVLDALQALGALELRVLGRPLTSQAQLITQLGIHLPAVAAIAAALLVQLDGDDGCGGKVQHRVHQCVVSLARLGRFVYAVWQIVLHRGCPGGKQPCWSSGTNSALHHVVLQCVMAIQCTV